MSIQSEITRIAQNVSDSFDAVAAKGGTRPQAQNSSNLPDAILSIPAAGVQSFNGRTGDVEPQEEDYTAEMVGAQPTINVSGILKGNGAGGVSAAVAGTDFAAMTNLHGRNLLDNPWFTINQRGITSATSPSIWEYMVDRWQFANTTGVRVTDDGLELTIVGRECSARQIMEHDLKGQTVTISILLDGVIYSKTLEFPNSGTIVFTFDGTSFGGRVGILDGLCYLRLESGERGAGAKFLVKAVKLELGSVSTLANDTPPNYAEELAKCQRYYWKVDYSAWPGVSPFRGAYDGGEISLNGLVFPVTMRTKPALTNVTLLEGASGAIKSVTDSTWGLHDYCYNVIYPTSGNLITGGVYKIVTAEFSADL